jgi:putative phosphotransacetylase
VADVVERTVVERIVREVVTARLGARVRAGGNGQPSALVVNASARHMHLTQEAFEKLFGPGAKLTPVRALYQQGQFAAEQTVTVVGPRRRLISNLRILGPLRNLTQIELAFTDAITLGIDDIPIRLSGDIKGTPGAYVMGPAGMLEMKEGVIRAAMHVHMSPADAERYGIKRGDIMKLRVGGAAGVTFDRVLVRVDPSFKLEVHMDTDEANACGLHLTQEVALLK